MNKKGFSLVELLIVIAVGGILIASLASVFVSQSRTYTIYSDIGEVQYTAKAVLDYIAKEIRMAGGGLLDREYKFKNGSSSATFVHISSINSSTGPDSIRIRGNFQAVFGVLSSSVGGSNIGDESIKVAYREKANFSAGNYITISDGINSEIRLITQVSSDKKTVSFANGDGLTYEHKNGTYFNGIQELRYYIDSNGVLRRNNFEANGNQPILENVEDLQFQYGMDIDNNGTVDGWANYIGEMINVGGINYSTDIKMLKQVKIWLLVRGNVLDSSFSDIKTYVLGDRSYQPPSNLRNYRRMLFETTVTLRNFRRES